MFRGVLFLVILFMDNQQGGNSSAIVAVVAIVILAGLAVAFFVYALPMLTQTEQPKSIELKLPAGTPTPTDNPGATY
jgi:hypothetical protein